MSKNVGKCRKGKSFGKGPNVGTLGFPLVFRLNLPDSYSVLNWQRIQATSWPHACFWQSLLTSVAAPLRQVQVHRYMNVFIHHIPSSLAHPHIMAHPSTDRKLCFLSWAQLAPACPLLPLFRFLILVWISHHSTCYHDCHGYPMVTPCYPYISIYLLSMSFLCHFYVISWLSLVARDKCFLSDMIGYVSHVSIARSKPRALQTVEKQVESKWYVEALWPFDLLRIRVDCFDPRDRCDRFVTSDVSLSGWSRLRSVNWVASICCGSGGVQRVQRLVPWSPNTGHGFEALWTNRDINMRAKLMTNRYKQAKIEKIRKGWSHV